MEPEMSVSREAEIVSKPLLSHNPNVDIGTIVGRGGTRKRRRFTNTLDARQELKFLLRKILTLFNGLTSWIYLQCYCTGWVHYVLLTEDDSKRVTKPKLDNIFQNVDKRSFGVIWPVHIKSASE